MDDKTYRRVFQETPSQARRRHNGLLGPMIRQRRCSRCGGSGRRGGDAADPKEDLVCHSCGGTGLKTYRR